MDFFKTRNGGQGYVSKSPSFFSTMGSMFRNNPSSGGSTMEKLNNQRRTTQSQLDQIK